MKSIYFVLSLTLKLSVCLAQIVPVDLRCESETTPLFIDIAQPVFSWKLQSAGREKYQQAYEIVLDESMSNVTAGVGQLWSSGKVVSPEHLQIEYDGRPLSSLTRYYWAVRVYDESGTVSTWSKPSFFETAMLSQEDWKAQWIADQSRNPENDFDAFKPDRMPLFRKEFIVAKNVSRARLYITGLGYYESYINGKKVGDAVLDPGWTAYGKEVLYSVYDVSAAIARGKNAIGVMLANGWWNPLPIKLFGRWDLRDYQRTGRPCLKAEIHIVYEDNSRDVFATDATWITTRGPVIRSSVYLGEWYDARLEFKHWNNVGTRTSGWRNAGVIKGPGGQLRTQKQPPIRITRIVKAKKITNPRPDTFIVDFGINFAGVARIKVKGPSGKQIALRYGEDVYADGTLNYSTTVMTQIRQGGISGGPGSPPTAWQEDRYICSGKGPEVWSPKFTFHGFRYVEITGWMGRPTVEDIEGLAMNSDLDEAGSFRCSNDSINLLQAVIKNTFLSNVFSVQSDCPGREKLGYGADMVVTANSFIYNYNMQNFYRKAINDFANDQQEDGAITETAPFVGIADRGYGGFSGPLGWQLAFPFLQKQMYDFYGDKRIIRKNYERVKRQLSFLESKAIEGLFHWDIGDHEALDPRPEAFSASSFYYHHALLASDFAGILDMPEDSVRFMTLAQRIKGLIVKKYLVPKTGRFDNATQSAQLFALWYDLSSEKENTFSVLMEEFKRHGYHVSCGIFGVKMMFDVLRERDQNELAYQVATQQDFPGWFHMLKKGATTLWESWEYPEKYPSQNHPMFGSITEWFYRSLLGINPTSTGFKNFQIKPQPAGDLRWAKGSYESPYGTIDIEWKIQDETFSLNMRVPVNTTAEIWLPATDGSVVSEINHRININERNSRRTGNYMVVKIGSGLYTFQSSKMK